MGNYRQHIGLAGFLGVLYAWGAYVGVGIHWLYGSVAALFATLGGLLPDLDHPIGVELKGFTGILGVLAAGSIWRRVVAHDPDLPIEWQIWLIVATYMLIRHGLRRTLARMMVHRGISHSLPTCAVWGAILYLNYPATPREHLIRVMMATAVMLGFLSHLVLDEICSVDLRGARVNKAFGSAMKLWSPSPWATLGIYAVLSYLSWEVVRHWPSGPLVLAPVAAPEMPSAWFPIEWPPKLDPPPP